SARPTRFRRAGRPEIFPTYGWSHEPLSHVAAVGTHYAQRSYDQLAGWLAADIQLAGRAPHVQPQVAGRRTHLESVNDIATLGTQQQDITPQDVSHARNPRLAVRGPT